MWYFNGVKSTDLEAQRVKFKVFKRATGSSSLQAMVFKHDIVKVTASSRHCKSQNCIADFSFCSLSEEIPLILKCLFILFKWQE